MITKTALLSVITSANLVRVRKAADKTITNKTGREKFRTIIIGQRRKTIGIGDFSPFHMVKLNYLKKPLQRDFFIGM